MAVNATLVRVELFLWRVMTGKAAQRRVLAVKFKFALRIVIEQPEVPAVRIVAPGTILAKPLLMLIILLMTGDAVTFGILE